jgi:hypothetical protein
MTGSPSPKGRGRAKRSCKPREGRPLRERLAPYTQATSAAVIVAVAAFVPSVFVVIPMVIVIIEPFTRLNAAAEVRLFRQSISRKVLQASKRAVAVDRSVGPKNPSIAPLSAYLAITLSANSASVARNQCRLTLFLFRPSVANALRPFLVTAPLAQGFGDRGVPGVALLRILLRAGGWWAGSRFAAWRSAMYLRMSTVSLVVAHLAASVDVPTCAPSSTPTVPWGTDAADEDLSALRYGSHGPSR